MAKQIVKRDKKAIVIGASMAGLLAARVLADHFEHVTLLERDMFPEPGANRKGVPQGKHTHILLELGLQIMEKYLPGLTAELRQSGAKHIADASLNVRWFHSGGYHQPAASGISSVGVSRPTLEALVRKRVLALSNVTAIENCKVLDLTTTGDHISGVCLNNLQKSNGKAKMLADLVVDASGRGSRSPDWLEKLGYSSPPTEEVQIGMGYTTCFFRRQPKHIPGLDGIVLLATPPNKHLAVLLAQDGNRWVVTIGGYLGDHAPTDYQSFLKAAKGLPAPHIYNVIKDAEPLGEPVAYKFPSNLRQRYEKLDSFPKGYLVFGDALCSFNPIYGQGMTVAAMEARALDECLSSTDNRLATHFFVKASKIIDISWSAAVGNDLGYAEIEGRRTPIVRFLNWYMKKVQIAAHHDARVSIAFLKLINMVAPPSIIMHPAIIWRVFKGNLWSAKRDGTSEPRSLPQPDSITSNG